MTQRPAIPKSTDPRIPKGYNWLIQQVGHQGDDCLLWPFSCCTPGYGIFMHEKKNRLAHRFMCELIHGAPPADHLAAHSCGNRRCVNPKHISWKTHTGNQLDRREQGTSSNKHSKLTLKQARQIRQLKGLETTPETASKYGITESNVRHIQDGKTWREVRKIPRPLTDEQVRIIRQIGDSRPTASVAEMLGVGQAAVWRVRLGRSHKSVV